MIEQTVVENLIEQDESPILEFKREWYWSSNNAEDLGPKWGEFYKDITSLCNAYLEYTGKDRYLIFGVCETTRELTNIDSQAISALRNLREFKRRIIARLE